MYSTEAVFGAAMEWILLFVGSLIFCGKHSCNGGLSVSDLNCQTGSPLFFCFLRELKITENNAVV